MPSSITCPGSQLVSRRQRSASGRVADPVSRITNWRPHNVSGATGALLAGIIADLLGLTWAIGAVGVLTLLSSVVVATVMTETLAARRTTAPSTASQPAVGSS